MLRICDESICKALGIIFRSCLQNSKFPQNRKSPMWFLFSEKNKKQVKNYCPISLLPVSSKIFERLLYDSMFTFFAENSLISQNQSGFKPGDSCRNQLLSIMHQSQKSFDDGQSLICVLHSKAK